MNLQAIKLNTFLKILTIVGAFALSLILTSQAQAAPQISVKNTTTGHETYSTGSTYASSVRAEPGDILEFQMFGNFVSASIYTVVLPNDLVYSGTTASTPAASVSASGQTITWTFSASSTEVIKFTATVVGGSALSTNHNLSASFTTDTAATSNTVAVTTGPIITAITPASGGDAGATNITITGHGLTGTTAVALSDGTVLDISNVTITDTSISGPSLKILALHATGSFWVQATVTASGNTLSNETNSSESATFTVTDGTEPVMSSAPSYVHSTGVLTLAFSESINVSATDLSKITLYDAAAAGNSQVLTGATKSATNASTITFTLTQAQINTISSWGAASNLYVQIAGSGIKDLSNNYLIAQGSRTAITTWTKDTVQPTATLVYTQNNLATTSVKAGSVTITATFSEPISATPNIAINQPGTTDISATVMTGSGTTWTYTYTLNAVEDGTATVALSNAADYANNTLGAVTGNTFIVDTFGPTPAITNLAGGAGGQTAATFSWTPTYTAGDFSTYKFYYRTTTGVTSATGTAIDKNTAGYSNLGTAATNTLSLGGLTAGTRYFAVIYICDTASNCSIISNEADAQTNSQAVISVPSSGGGGGGGASSPSTASSAGTITESGGTITTNISGGSSATVSIPANTIANGTVAVSEATTAEKQAAPLASSQGVIVGNTVFNIQLSGVPSPTFNNPITLEFVYDPAQLGGINPNALNVSFYSATEKQWVSLPSMVNTTTHKVTAQTTHFTLFAITTLPAASSQTSTTPAAPTDTATPDTGNILGTSVGAYPNGALLKAPNAPAVWYIGSGQKHVVTSAAVFNTRFNWNDIVYLPSTRQLDLYTAGDAVTFSAGTLTKEEGKSAVYRISATNGKQPILSSNVFLSRGYKWNQVIEVAPSGLANYPEQAYISEITNFYSGDVVKIATTGKIYQIETNSARLVPNVNILQANKLDKKPIRSITAKEFKQFTAGPEVFYPDGTLVKGSSAAIYMISDGKKRAFTSGADLDALLFNRKQIKVVADKVLAAIESIAPIKLAQKNIHTANVERD